MFFLSSAEARNVFKKYVNTLATVVMENVSRVFARILELILSFQNVKHLVLRPKYMKQLASSLQMGADEEDGQTSSASGDSLSQASSLLDSVAMDLGRSGIKLDNHSTSRQGLPVKNGMIHQNHHHQSIVLSQAQPPQAPLNNHHHSSANHAQRPLQNGNHRDDLILNPPLQTPPAVAPPMPLQSNYQQNWNQMIPPTLQQQQQQHSQMNYENFNGSSQMNQHQHPMVQRQTSSSRDDPLASAIMVAQINSNQYLPPQPPPPQQQQQHASNQYLTHLPVNHHHGQQLNVHTQQVPIHPHPPPQHHHQHSIAPQIVPNLIPNQPKPPSQLPSRPVNIPNAALPNPGQVPVTSPVVQANPPLPPQTSSSPPPRPPPRKKNSFSQKARTSSMSTNSTCPMDFVDGSRKSSVDSTGSASMPVTPTKNNHEPSEGKENLVSLF